MLCGLVASTRQSEVNEQHEGKRKNEALWPVFQINWQRSRYVYDMHYVYKAITKDVLEYCIRNVSGDLSCLQCWMVASSPDGVSLLAQCILLLVFLAF